MKPNTTPFKVKAKGSFALDFPDLGGKMQHIFEGLHIKIKGHEWKKSIVTRKITVDNSKLCPNRKRTGRQDYATLKEEKRCMF